MSAFHALVATTALLAGGIASVAGFGIGSVLTPLLATRFDTKVAVAAVSIPHLTATALRFWMLRRELDRRVFVAFGIPSAAGGLAGALLHTLIGGRVLTIVLASALVFTGAIGLLGITLRFGRGMAPVAGFFSGLLGGLVGNQGGIRTGAMLGFDLPKEAFVTTSTAVGLVVDGARMPVYVWNEGASLLRMQPTIAIMIVGVVAGTLLGRLVLGRIPEPIFKRVVSGLVLVLGIALFFQR